MNRSPLPWFVDVTSQTAVGAGQGPTTYVALGCTPEDARFIVQACNSHAQLLAALRNLIDAAAMLAYGCTSQAYMDKCLSKARAAIAAADGK